MFRRLRASSSSWCLQDGSPVDSNLLDDDLGLMQIRSGRGVDAASIARTPRKARGHPEKLESSFVFSKLSSSKLLVRMRWRVCYFSRWGLSQRLRREKWPRNGTSTNNTTYVWCSFRTWLFFFRKVCFSCQTTREKTNKTTKRTEVSPKLARLSPKPAKVSSEHWAL